LNITCKVLNLCFETREGILKHCSARNARRLAAQEPQGPAQRFLDGTQPSLEAQLVNLADAMAYNAHDIDDGVRSGLLSMSQLDDVALFAHWRDAALADHPHLAAQPGRRLLQETLRRLLSALIEDLVICTQAAVDTHAPADADALRQLPALAQFSAPVQADVTALQRFLFQALYRHPQVVQSTALGRTVVTELFAAYLARPQEMPEDYAAAHDLPRSVADYVAGMTDRFALREHHRLTGRRLFADA
jgi:dGTPase